MRVKATRSGFRGRLYAPGDVFECPEFAFSSKWMTKLEEPKAEESKPEVPESPPAPVVKKRRGRPKSKPLSESP